MPKELKGMSQKSCDIFIVFDALFLIISIYVFCILVIIFMTAGNVHPRLHAEMNYCNSSMGKVLNVVDNEFFTIEICDEVKTFEEFSYCFGVQEGDMVIFDWDPLHCEMVSFSVLKNGTQCGVLCK